jgi:hypothetical protein
MKITLTDSGFTAAQGKHSRAVEFDKIATVAAEKVGKITYDEVFLIIRDQSGDGVTLGELDDGFAAVERELRARLPNFPAGWWAEAEASPIGIRTEIWPVVVTPRPA